jgi:thymidylate synthase (FAD)
MPVKLMSFTDKPEELIAKAYGICTNKKVPVENIPKWVGLGHETPLEHAVATFLVYDISRACSHQLVRHRLASYSQESQRYVKVDGEDIFVFPPTLSQEQRIIMEWSFEEALQDYHSLIEMGAKPEDARFVLPNATKTRLIMTANFREWRHIISLRAHKSAQWEIREVAKAILNHLYEVAPNVFGDLKEKYADS